LAIEYVDGVGKGKDAAKEHDSEVSDLFHCLDYKDDIDGHFFKYSEPVEEHSPLKNHSDRCYLRQVRLLINVISHRMAQ
jgi:hypothetical protein